MKAVHESLLDSLDAAERARKELEDRLKVVMVQSNRDQRQLKCASIDQKLACGSLRSTVCTGCYVLLPLSTACGRCIKHTGASCCPTTAGNT
jgi:hypothetical protein